MSEINQSGLDKFTTDRAEKSKKDLIERHNLVLKEVKEYAHPQERVENKFNEIVSALQERGLSADVKIIQDFVSRFKASVQSLWRKEGREIMRDGQKIIDSAMKD